MKRIVLLALIPLALMPLVAKAQWLTKTDDDLFNNGQKAMLMGSLNNSSSAVIFDCTKKSLSISYVEPDSETKVENAVPVNLVVKIDKAEAVTLDANLSRRNDQAIAVESTDVESIKSILKSLHDARQKILIGMETSDGGNQSSFSGGVSNSTNAVNKFTAACEISL